jgi:drug/metabolite transporter (DMT)-like permease
MSQPPPSLLSARIAVPFLLVSLIWGSTWVVIADQIKTQPPLWSVVWRFAPACLAAFALAMVTGKSLILSRPAHALAMALGLFQFCGNYALVYLAELHLTSGIVAVLVSLLIVPNALLGRWLLGEPITRGFVIGSVVAIAGIVLLLVNEAQTAQLGRDVPFGVALALGSMLAASIASVIQAGETGRSVPMASLLAFSMLYGTGVNVALAWASEGPPVIPTSPTFWAGALYLAIIGSVLTFTVYWQLVREIGAGRAAYQGVVSLIIAMALSTLFEDYRWTALAIGGSLLALVGLVIALRARSPAK